MALFLSLTGRRLAISVWRVLSSLDRPAALGFVDSTISKDGQQLVAVAGGRNIEVTTAALPLVPHRYARPVEIIFHLTETEQQRKKQMIHYTKDHEWIEIDGDTGTVGILPHAIEQLWRYRIYRIT